MLHNQSRMLNTNFSVKGLIKAIALFILVIPMSIFAQTTTNPGVVDSTSVFKDVVNSYLRLEDALTKDQADEATMAAKYLYNAIEEAPMAKMTADQHKVWMTYHEKLGYDAEHIKGTDDIDHQREHFVSLSSNMFNLLKGLKINIVDLYYQYCPMANEGKGAYWVSQQSEIDNPSMGKKMPSCGSTKETLKAKN